MIQTSWTLKLHFCKNKPWAIVCQIHDYSVVDPKLSFRPIIRKRFMTFCDTRHPIGILPFASSPVDILVFPGASKQLSMSELIGRMEVGADGRGQGMSISNRCRSTLSFVHSRIQTWQKIAFNISNPVKSMLTTKISEKTWAGSFLAWRCQKRRETCYETTSVSSCCWRSMRISNTMTVLKLGPAHWPMKFCRHKWS